MHRAEPAPEAMGGERIASGQVRAAPGEEGSASSRLRRRRRRVLPAVATIAGAGAVLQLAPPLLLLGGPAAPLLVAALLLGAAAVVVLARRKPRLATAALAWAVLFGGSLAAFALGGASAVGLAWLVDAAALGAVLFVPLRRGWVAPACAVVGAALAVGLSGAPPVAGAVPVWLGAVLAAAPVAAGAALTLLFAGMNRDVEVELRAEVERRRAAEAEARAAGLAREELLARIVHDLRTPMHGVVGLADVLWRGPLSESQQRQVGLILRQGETFLALVNDLLDLAQMSARKLEIRPRDFDLRALVDETLSLVEPQAGSNGLTLERRVDGGIPERLFGDSARLRQILTNLAGNAVKFTSTGGVTLVAEPDGRTDSGQLWVRLEVRDTGPGIPADHLERLFQPFEMRTDVQGDRIRGSGLGLAISRELAQLMGGELTVESRMGRGTTFRLRVPLAPGQHPTRDLVAPAPGLELAPGVYRGASGSGRLLIVEDDPVNREVLQSQLGLLGLAADEVASGADAILRFAPGRYEAVLLDCDLPDLDGFEVARRLRRREAEGGPRTPLIAVTASSLRAESETWRRSDFDDLLLKPYRIHELASMLSAWLGARIEAPGAARGEGSPDAGTVDAPAVVDLTTLDALAALDPTAGESPARRLLEVFRAHAGRDVAWIVEQLDTPAAERADESTSQVAHRLKGAAASAGALRLSRLAAEIESAAQTSSLSAAREAVSGLRPSFEEALAVFEARLIGLSGAAASNPEPRGLASGGVQ